LVVTLAVGVISIAGGRSWSFVPLLALWGVGHAAGFVLCQVRVMSAGDRAPAFAMSLNIAACNLGIAVGALAGGVLIEASGLRMLGVGTAAFAALAVSSAVIIQRIDQRRGAASAV
jgi:DHA1 family inner membrane transport protein